MHLSLFYHTDYCTGFKLPKEKAVNLGIRSTLAKEQSVRFHLLLYALRRKASDSISVAIFLQLSSLESRVPITTNHDNGIYSFLVCSHVTQTSWARDLRATARYTLCYCTITLPNFLPPCRLLSWIWIDAFVSSVYYVLQKDRVLQTAFFLLQFSCLSPFLPSLPSFLCPFWDRHPNHGLPMLAWNSGTSDTSPYSTPFILLKAK